jgi:putative endonuclease
MPYSFVYIMTNKHHTVLYTGVTADLSKRLWWHKNPPKRSFCRQYNVNRLVYYEVFEDIRLAIAREKQIKAGSRKAKLALIERSNPGWEDLAGRL